MFRLAFVAIVRLQSSSVNSSYNMLNPLNAELNPICNLLALLGAHPILHVSRVTVKKKEKEKRLSARLFLCFSLF